MQPSTIEQQLIEIKEESENESEIQSESCITSIKKNIFNGKNEQIVYTVTIFALGDAIWSALSYLNFGINLKPTNNTNFDIRGQWAGQQLYSTVGMGLLGIAIAAWYKSKKEYAKSVDVMTIAAAGSLSLYAWDRAQTSGIDYFKKIGYPDNVAGYLSSIFTGFAEAITQFLFLKIVNLFLNKEEYNLFKNTATIYFKRLLSETGLNITIGLIPGAVWQLVYNAAVINTIGALATGMSVAIAVALSNIFSMKCIQGITKAESYNNCFGTVSTEESDTHAAAPCMQCLNWFNHSEKTEKETEISASLLPQII